MEEQKGKTWVFTKPPLKLWKTWKECHLTTKDNLISWKWKSVTSNHVIFKF